jgi:hypothetical protein
MKRRGDAGGAGGGSKRISKLFDIPVGMRLP